MRIKTSRKFNSSDRINPFIIENKSIYESWRDEKLNAYPRDIANIVVEVDNPYQLKTSEYKKLLEVCRKTNMVLYSSKVSTDPDPEIPLTLGRQFIGNNLDNNWLSDASGLSSLTVANRGIKQQFIPYTNREIQWHTDGYYNPQHQQVHSLLLHVVQRAATGGENSLMDHEIAYIMLREKNPDYIRALMKYDVMTIPARITDGKIARAEESGPVFSINADGDLHMRYTVRANNVIWSENQLTQEALSYLKYILGSRSNYIFSGLLEPGMGLLSNNVLHNRTAFTDDKIHKRHIYRARYYNRITGTNVFNNN
jgi:hypothetical protein